METLEKHTHKPSGDIFVFRHAFLWGEGMVYRERQLGIYRGGVII